MKGFSKFANGFSVFVLFICMLLVVTQSAMANSEKMIGSAEDHGIKLTINHYAIVNYGQEMMVYYTVQSKTGLLMDEDGISLMQKPNITIGNRLVQGKDTWHKKISSQQIQGAVKVMVPQYRPAISNVEFNTDNILNQKGQWTINFQIKK